MEVAFPNVLTGLLGPLGATPNVGEALEILDDLHNRVCPAASGGTDGQVCARNTAGTAYELVDGGAGFGGLSELTSVQLANADQLLVSDVSDSGGTTKYSTAMTIAQRLSSVSVFAGLLADGDYVSVIDISEPVGDRVKRIGYDTLRDELTDTIIAEIVVETPLEGAGTTGDPFGMTPASIVTGFLADEAVTIAKMGSGTAASGDVATADGSGGVEWQAGGGGGGGGSFDLHDDVTGYVGTGALSGNDRMVVSDESLAGDPNRYAEVDDVVQRLYALGLSEVISTGTPADNDLVFIGDTSRGTGNRVRAIELSDLLERLDVGDIGSGSATDGQVATADGSGGVDWEAGGAGSFDLHDDVTTYVGAGNFSLLDRMVISDESETDDPNRYVETRDIIEGLHDKIAGSSFNTAPANNDLFPVSDQSRSVGGKIRGLRWDELLGYLPVASMDSGSATDGQVATADGSGAIAWEAAGGGDFHLYDDVPTYVGNGNVVLADRMVLADTSQPNNPNRYVTVRDVVEEMYDHMNNRAFGVAPADDDLILLGDVSQTVTNRIRGTTWQNVEESLEVDAMDSGTATDGQVAYSRRQRWH